jgi:hypothetical protein
MEKNKENSFDLLSNLFLREGNNNSNNTIDSKNILNTNDNNNNLNKKQNILIDVLKYLSIYDLLNVKLACKTTNSIIDYKLLKNYFKFLPLDNNNRVNVWLYYLEIEK